MDRFRELSAFVTVAEAGAFNAAARRIGASPPAVTRLINGLEARLGVQLFTRTTRQVALTEAGTRLLADAARILAELEAAEASAAGAHQAPQGMLRVTAPVEFGERYIGPILRAYLARFPAVTGEALFLDRVVDIIGEGLDVAVRIGDLPDSSLTARKVASVRLVAVAAPSYLEAYGPPAEPAALADHRLIFHSGSGAPRRWDFTAGGVAEPVRITPALAVNTVESARDAAAAGFGIARLISYQVAGDLAAGRLVEILARHEDRDLPVHLVHSEGRRPAAKIRAFIDLAAERLRAQAHLLSAR